MIKNIGLALFGFVLLFAFSSCEKDRAFVEFDDLEKGAFARKIDGVNGTYDFFNIDGSTIDFTVEFYDENQGQDVAEYNWTVEYVDNANSTTSAPVTIANRPASSFTPSADGLPSTSFSFGMREVMDALGLGDNDIAGGDAFRFKATIVMTDGRTFTAENTGTNIISSAPFSGWFRFDQSIICPSDLGGVFDYTTTETWCGAAPISGTAEWIDEGNGVYNTVDFSYGAYELCYGAGATLPHEDGAGDLRIENACDIIKPIGASRWGELYVFESVSTSGPDLTISWSNDYGEAGTVTLTRTDGRDWPNLTN
ncbi:MAG: hypothetical protein MRY78_11380 [Saprospiraceae bacterium]|nr:hypothetical protein [Saprospiraceae bacterium]